MITGDPWFDHQVERNEELMFPTDLNRDFTAEQCFRMKVSITGPPYLADLIQFMCTRKLS